MGMYADVMAEFTEKAYADPDQLLIISDMAKQIKRGAFKREFVEVCFQNYGGYRSFPLAEAWAVKVED